MSAEITDRLRGWLERRKLSQNGREDDPHFEAELEYCDDMILDTAEELLLARQLYALPTQGRDERLHLYRWIRVEENYVADKFDDQRNGHDDEMRDHHLRDDGFWLRQIVQYYDRARMFFDAALDHEPGSEQHRALTMRGQQALAKAMMTAKGCVESSIRVFGPMPKPGVSSGNIEEWIDQS